jgi:hypothetical protein
VDEPVTVSAQALEVFDSRLDGRVLLAKGRHVMHLDAGLGQLGFICGDRIQDSLLTQKASVVLRAELRALRISSSRVSLATIVIRSAHISLDP